VPDLAAERQNDLIITRGASGAAARAVQRRCVAGELARLAPGIYVYEREPQAQAIRVREHWVRILGELVPGSVVSYRSAYTAVPSESVLVLSHPTRFNRTIRLPGLRVALVKGPGPLPGDTPLRDGALHLASMERMLLENLTRPRGHEGRSRGEAAVQARLEQILADGPEALDRLRGRACKLALPLSMERELARLEQLIDALRVPAASASSRAQAAAAGSTQFQADPACVQVLEALADRLRAQRMQRVAAPPEREPDRSHRAFVEAWFDCFDSADALSIELARAAVLGGQVGVGGSAPMRELLSAFKLAVTSPLCDSVPPFGHGFAQALQARHALMTRLAEPGEAGRLRVGAASIGPDGTVEPARIASTLAVGSTLALSVPEGLARAIFYSILLWRVQPFEHGNERLVHLTMNAELSSVGECRIVVPARMRARLERSREDLVRGIDPDRYIRLLAVLQRWTALLDGSDLDRLQAQLARMRAFERSGARPVRPRP
jgi:hypothetical protein